MLTAEAPLLKRWMSAHHVDLYALSDRARLIDTVDEVNAVARQVEFSAP